MQRSCSHAALEPTPQPKSEWQIQKSRACSSLPGHRRVLLETRISLCLWCLVWDSRLSLITCRKGAVFFLIYGWDLRNLNCFHSSPQSLPWSILRSKSEVIMVYLLLCNSIGSFSWVGLFILCCSDTDLHPSWHDRRTQIMQFIIWNCLLEFRHHPSTGNSHHLSGTAWTRPGLPLSILRNAKVMHSGEFHHEKQGPSYVLSVKQNILKSSHSKSMTSVGNCSSNPNFVRLWTLEFALNVFTVLGFGLIKNSTWNSIRW